MEDLPYADQTFDNVISTFGVMFAPDQVRVARELKRICSHRGKIAMASWTQSGFFGKLISVLVEYMPLPSGLILPTIWATDDFLTEHFGESNTTIYNNLRRYTLRYPSPEHWLELFSKNVSLVGHSFGGSVALKVAMLAELNVQNLVLLEPNPFWLLRQQNRLLAYEEARALRDHVKFYGVVGDWPVVAARFADYWLGRGTWKSMPDKRRAAFLEALVPNFHEWDAVMDESSALEQIGGIAANTLLVSDPQTVLPIREIAGLFVERFSHWRYCSVAGAGHMAPVTNPDLINPIIADFLSGDTVDSAPTEN
jgi:pimeloyl-ACP methyl ester carboxylesterase